MSKGLLSPSSETIEKFLNYILLLFLLYLYHLSSLFRHDQRSLVYSYDIGRYKQSLEIFIRTETMLQRTDCESHYYIAKMLTKNVSHGQLKRQDAKEYFIKAISSGHLESMHELAEIYIKEGDLRKSIELLQKSLQ